MRNFGIAKRYSTALWAFAGGVARAETWLEVLSALSKALDESSDLRRVVSNPLFDSKKKMAVLNDILGKMGAPKEVLAFVDRVTSAGRMSAFQDIVEAFRVKVMSEKGIIELQVESALPLTAEQKSDLAARFEKMTSKKVVVISKVSPALLSGMKVSYGGKTLDGSLKTYLNNLEKHLLKEDFTKHATA